jgi:hypothetical protein
VRYDVLTMAKMSMLVVWVVIPCGLVGRVDAEFVASEEFNLGFA